MVPGRKLRLVRNGGLSPHLVDDQTGEMIAGQARVSMDSKPSSVGVVTVELVCSDLVFAEIAQEDALSGWEMIHGSVA